MWRYTLDPAEADFFFVPIYGECFLFRETQRSGGAALDITAGGVLRTTIQPTSD